MASVAILGSMLLPEMKKRGYKDNMAMGSILASGGLAVLIPPSALAVLFASIAQVSVGKVLMAIIGPGLLLAFFYCLYIIGKCSLQPSIAPAYDIGYFTLRYKVVAIAKYVLPLGFIIFSVIGVILLGIASVTETSVLGAVATFVSTIFY
jgi:TRAP-type mannitol/chloroaromatic compound transport system permease large subunit